MLKNPKNLPSLGEPNFVLANPVWMQLAVVLVFLLVLPLVALLWVGGLLLAGQAESAHFALAAVAALFLGCGLLPRNWRRWVVFAADRRGVYLATYQGAFHHVPWRNVGPASIDIAGIGSNRQRTVILRLKVDEDTWSALLGGRKRRVNAPADAAGFRPFGIGNAARNVEETLRQIEALRRQFGA